VSLLLMIDDVRVYPSEWMGSECCCLATHWLSMEAFQS